MKEKIICGLRSLACVFWLLIKINQNSNFTKMMVTLLFGLSLRNYILRKKKNVVSTTVFHNCVIIKKKKNEIRLYLTNFLKFPML